MKFMKRSKDKVEKEQFQEEGEEYFDNQLTSYMRKQTGQFILEPSYLVCEKLIDGRVSFQGMNPEIEKIMENEAQGKIPAQKQKEEDADVSDSEMADRFRKLKKIKPDNSRVKSVHKKWLKKEEQPPVQEKRKFLKPED